MKTVGAVLVWLFFTFVFMNEGRKELTIFFANMDSIFNEGSFSRGMVLISFPIISTLFLLAIMNLWSKEQE